MSTDASTDLSFRSRLLMLLDEYDSAPRGSADHRLSAYVRACVSSRDALELRLAYQAGLVSSGFQHEAMFAGDPRPEVTVELCRRRAEVAATKQAAS